MHSRFRRANSEPGRVQRYVPVLPGSALWSVLSVVVTLANVSTPNPRNGRDHRWDSAAMDARRFVAASWGAQPDPHSRLEGRNLIHGAVILLFVVGGVPSVAVFGLGLFFDQVWLSTIGGVALAGSALIMGLDGPVIARSFFMNVDFHKWTAAGKPDSWTYSPGSQPRSSDLIWAGLWGLAVASFFATLTLG